jgi:hypothetical protein
MIPENIKKIERSQFLTYINTTPSAVNPKWDVLGIGITGYGIAYNPQVDTEKWIIEDNARNDHSSNQKQSSVTQKCYKADPVFEFVSEARDQLNYKSQVLDIDRCNGTGTTYPAKLTDILIAVNNYMGEEAEIEYTIYYNGDSTEGTVTFSGTTPSFQPTVSL